MEKNIDLKSIILDTLDSNKALDIISIDLKNKRLQKNNRSKFFHKS